MNELLLDRLQDLLIEAQDEGAENTAEEIQILIDDYEAGIYLN